jgi:predicted nucleic acid-binding protein
VKAYVIDSSIAMTWLFADEKRDDCDDLQQQLAGDATAVVPQHWPVEVANNVLVGERRKRVSQQTTKPFIDLLQSLPIALDDSTRDQSFSDGLTLARQHGLTVYDALYLELALRRGLPLASLDKSLRKAAASEGVDCFPARL